jgi:putative tricarboxylic transport membrane protein
MTDATESDDERVVGVRGPEVGVAALLFAVGALVVTDSLRVGIGWADDGPRSGYFPFYVGLLLMGASAWTMVRGLLGRSPLKPVFARRTEVGQVLAVLLPMVVYVALVAVLGIYVASFLLIAYFMKRHGGYGWPLTVAVAAGVPIAFYVLFERWFLVLLPKGPLEAALGL